MVSQLGNEIIDHFNDASRGNLAGMNDSGIEITSMLLSLETSGFDPSIRTTANNNEFTLRGLDSLSDRTSNLRSGFSFFFGVEAAPPPGALAFADRRRIIVIDNRDAQNPVIRHNDIPLDSGSLGSANIELIRAAVNNTPIAEGLDFTAWLGEFSIPSGQDGPADDPDLDGATNLLEFSAGTDPLQRNSFPQVTLEKAQGGVSFSYERLIEATGISRTIQTGPLSDITTTHLPAEEDLTVTPIDDDREKVTVSLPSTVGPFFRLSVEEN